MRHCTPGRSEVVELVEVAMRYPGGVDALRDVSLTISHGEAVAIVGPSGSGKSTLMHIVGTLDRPTAGRATICGHQVEELSDQELSALRAQHIGFVFQQFHLSAGRSAAENVADGLLYAGVARGERLERARSALERVGLGHRLTHRPHELSGGEKQRVAIARALIGDPELVLADEPTGALDTRTGSDIMRLLHELNADGATICVITHDLEVAAGLGRHIAIRDGRIAAA